MSDDPTRVREFFGARAADWDSRFPDDGPAYAAAVAELGLRPGGSVLDAGCGTGRALPPLRAAVGPSGTVVGVDLTPEMLERAVRAGRGGADGGALLLADVGRLPVRDGALDAVFGAGLVSHLADPAAGLREFARVVRPGGRLALFHPIGRGAPGAPPRRPPRGGECDGSGGRGAHPRPGPAVRADPLPARGVFRRRRPAGGRT
ncbi:class I SAM-dependent methyltransferase, partial [Streptomyces sp. NPDC058861]|uniref:class I SAM-dependent methyltransferase n=1 Tax=Streptomyces sp. NPDC058861 TaxID=3346653 RepID=UPI003699C71C